MANVGFNEVQAYAKTNNVDFKTAAKKLGLSEKEAADLEKLGGDPGAPVDGFQKKKQSTINGKPVTLEHNYKLKSGRQVQVFRDQDGKQIFQYKAADGTALKESYFMKQEGMDGKRFAVNDSGQLVTIKDKAKQEEKSWWDSTKEFVKEHTGEIVAGAAVVGLVAGGIMCATGVGASVGGPLMAACLGVGVLGLTSCSEDNTIIQEVDITIKANSSLEAALDALLQGQEVTNDILKQILAREIQNGMTLDEIMKLTGGNQKLLNAILDALTIGNQLLGDIRNDINTGNKDILEAIMNVQNSVDVIANLIAKLPDDIKNEFQGDLNAILNAIKNGNVSLEQLNKMMQNVLAKLTQINGNVEINGDTLQKIEELIKNIQIGAGGSDAEILLQMLELLKSIDFTTKNIDNKLDVIINKFENVFPDNSDIKAALERIEQYLKENNAKTDKTNELLEKLLEKYQAGGLSEADLQKILDAIGKLGVEVGGKLDAILSAIKGISVGNGGAELEALLNKILAKMDANTADIINAINNIKVTGGAIDLGSLEAMLKEILAAIQKNGTKLDDLNIKMDVLNVTAKSIEAKLDENNKDHKVIIDILNKLQETQGKGYDDTKLMAILELISGKLDDILAAIKDHDVNVTVDVTGKVTCECNCGNNHEGILGDLNDLLG